MADIALDTNGVRVVFPTRAEVYDFVATEAIAAGEIVYLLSTGLVGVADANAAGKQQALGMALEGAAAGEAVSIIIRGAVSGFTLGTKNGIVYLSDTAGKMADAAGTMTVRLGKILNLSNKPTYTEMVYIDIDMAALWS